MFATGLAIFTGVAILLAKLKRKYMLRALNHPLAIDLAVSAAVLVIHWGSFEGVMGATIAALMCSVATSAARKLFGYIHGNQYFPGIFAVDPVA
jgi:hypothetical protein